MPLYRVREMSDVFVDACVRDTSGDLLFLSCYGRDTALTQLFAAFSLSPAQGGFTQITLEADDGCVHRVGIAGAERFKKLAGRLPKDNLFGNVAQTWIYDPIVLEPDRSNRIGWVLLDLNSASSEASAIRTEIDRRVWAMYQILSPVPLLPAWERPIRNATREAVHDMQASPFPALGRISALLVHLPAEFSEQVSQLVKTRVIDIVTPTQVAIAA
ncbi:MAG: hypothetical protein V4568_01775 [Pseudomonadota bacterium]